MDPSASSESLQKDSQQNIKNEHFIYDYICPIMIILAPENGGNCCNS